MAYMLVFGSLRKHSKRGFNFDRFGKGSQEYIKTLDLPGFIMKSLGSYPAIIPGEGTIKVELHKVEDEAFKRICRMELGAGYKEEKITLTSEDVAQASIFVWDSRPLTDRKTIESGDWD